ncbi:tRNA pseudouridine(55) synthase TruB [Alkalicoccus urumqiensis]|uniref:tRNA pseudouridine synthase B n=2 Tax=Alkalicoccus urumqiensis TaxID=1548213 RepID=A0A2P6MGB7_ALKUR|nr:tRNA pseudouridine(55) synthase TruB [Alkalicoccus urumqiensis]
MTSFDVVQRVRSILKTKKVGHTGTLDPDVEGVLPICVGRATKLAEYLTSERKVYEGTAAFGTSTTTEDASGEVIEESVPPALTDKKADELLKTFTGSLWQKPPMYSAVKINGKKLYEYAREGKVINRPEREITIYHLRRTAPVSSAENHTLLSFEVECSKGTYIRTLTVQFGEKLDVPAHMASLKRTRAGSFTVEDCIPLDQLKAHPHPWSFVQPAELLFPQSKGITVDSDTAEKILNGAVLPASGIPSGEWFPVYTEDGILLALYKPDSKRDGFMKPEKMYRTSID